jgi:hypothetical protein
MLVTLRIVAFATRPGLPVMRRRTLPRDSFACCSRCTRLRRDGRTECSVDTEKLHAHCVASSCSRATHPARPAATLVIDKLTSTPLHTSVEVGETSGS